MDTRNTPSVAKFFLKKRGLVLRRSSDEGFTLVEILIVIAIIAILAIIVLLALRPGPQIAKAHDARRKSDLVKIQRCLEEYNNDHNYYLPPNLFTCGGTGLSPCVASIPCDPFRNESYGYEVDDAAIPKWYRLYTHLEYTSDPAIATSGCSSGCTSGSSTYNYNVSSPNAPAITTAICSGATAPICGQPQNYVGVCASCCTGTQMRVQLIAGTYYCCPDTTCP